MYGPGRPPRASKHSAVSSVTQAALSALAAVEHLALATSCVVPWSSGTGVSSRASQTSLAFPPQAPSPNASFERPRATRIKVFGLREKSREGDRHGLTIDSRTRALDPAAAGLEDLAHLAQLVRVSRDEDWDVSFLLHSTLAGTYRRTWACLLLFWCCCGGRQVRKSCDSTR